jgi:hypothetical protein
MHHHPAPRHFTAQGTLPSIGLPASGDPRDARIALRRAFAELKQTFLAAVADLQDAQAAWLCAQVRSAEQPVDLWLLRAPLFEALSGADPERRRRRQMVRRGLDSLFHDSEPLGPSSAFTAF